jgi:hypothetical protein
MIYIDQQVNLKKLDIGETPITNQGLLVLKDLHKLEELKLNSTWITSDGLAVLQSMPELKKLNIGSTKIDVRAIPHIAKLKKLEELNISKTDIVGPCLSPLGQLNLQILNLSATRLKASDLASLHGFPQLKQLALSDCQMDNSAIRYLIPLPALTNLEIHDTNFGDDCAQYLSKLSHLKALDMSSTKFTKKGLETLAHSLGLHEIHMQNDEVNQDTINVLKNFHDLHVLDIQNCDGIDNDLVKTIATIKTIDSLNIAVDDDNQSKSKLTPKVIAILATEMPQLIDLDLRNTNTIDKDSLSELLKMKNLRALHLQNIIIEHGGGHENLTLLRAKLPSCDIQN